MRGPGRITRFVDWAVGLVSPRAAVKRAHFRRMEEDSGYRESVFTLLRARGYRSATDDSKSTPWSGSNLSADGEVLRDAPRMRSRARELHRDDSLASGIMDTLVREIMGTELRPQSAAVEKDHQTSIEAVWEDLVGALTPTDPGPFGQWLRTLGNKYVEDGDFCVKRAISNPGEPVWFETIEAERLATPSDWKPGDLQDSLGEIREGVERDRDGRVIAYWIMKKHPGDFVAGTKIPLTLQASYVKSNFHRVTLDAARHMKVSDRPGQSRGVTLLRAVLKDLHDLDLLMLASLKRVQISACFALFIKTLGQVPDLLEATADNYGYRMKQDIVPGMIFKLYPNEEVSSHSPNFPVPELESFVIMLCRRIGAALGVSWQTVLRDWSGSTYSSARTQLIADAPTTAIIRHDLREGVLNWVFTTVLEDAALRGDKRLAGIPFSQFKLVKWISDGRAWIDPLKEAQATELKLKMRVATLRDICAEQGKDWEEQLEQSLTEEAREAEIRKAKGLPPKVDPAAAPPAPGPRSFGNDDEEEREERRQIAALRAARRAA